MKNFISYLMMLMMMAVLLVGSGCSLETIDAGEEKVLIKQPWVFGQGGVDQTPLKSGSAWVAWSTKAVTYNIKPVKLKESFVDLTASDNVLIDFDVYLTLKIQDGKTPLLHEKSGVEFYKNKVQDEFRLYVRNHARTKSSIELRTDENTIIETQDTIKRMTAEYIKSIGLPVDTVKVNIGKVNPPDEVLKESAQTAAQKQRKQTQTQRKLTEDERAKAETSMALADKAYANEFNMTTEQFLRNKELDIMAQAVKTGKVTLIMNASDAQPMMQVQ